MGGGDPGRICIESATEQVVFNDYANAVKKEVRICLKFFELYLIQVV